MKKSLFALAVLGAFAGAASAQTNVTLYGVADISLAKTVGNDTQMSSAGMMNNGTSRIGFRGTEDLGGGLKAAFNFEAGLNMETGAQEAVFFQRQANMALSGNWGTVSLGRMLTPGFFANASYELTGAANYSALANQFGYTGGARNSSEFRYTTPNFNGFTAAVGYVTEADLGGAPLDNKFDLNAIYKGGPISAGLAYSSLPAANAAGDDADYSIGGAYNFGSFKVAASYLDHASTSAKGFTLGGGTTLGPVSLVLDIARETTTGNKNTDYLVEAKYNLSKRTVVYGAFLREGGEVGRAEGNNFGLGVRHNF